MGAEGYGGPEQAGGGGGASLTLAQAYANGSGSASSTMTLDATRAGLVVTASGLTGVQPVTINHSLAPASGAEVSFVVNGTFAPASGTATYSPVSISYTVNQTGGANGAVTGLLLNATEMAVVGTHKLLDLMVGAASRFTVAASGALTNSVSGTLVFGTDASGGYGSTASGGTLTFRGTSHANNDGTVIITSANTVSTTPVLRVETTSASGYALISLRSNSAERGGIRSDFGGTTRLYASGSLELGAGGGATTPSIRALSTGETLVLQGLYGGSGASGNFTISSTSNGTKGYVYLGSSTGLSYDEINKRIGINNATPECLFQTGTTLGLPAFLGTASMPSVISLQSGAGTFPGIFFGSASNARGALYWDDGNGIQLTANTGVLNLNGSTAALITGTQVQLKPGGVFALVATTSGVFGTTGSAGNMTIGSTTNATKGFVYLGSSTGLVYDETNKYLGVGVSPSAELHISKSAAISTIFQSTSGASTVQIKSGGAGNNAQMLYEISAGQDWLLGNKQSDGTFRISNSTTLGTGDVLIFDPTSKRLQFPSTGITANGSGVVTAPGSIGPSAIAVQEWLTVRNASGTTRYIPLYG